MENQTGANKKDDITRCDICYGILQIHEDRVRSIVKLDGKEEEFHRSSQRPFNSVRHICKNQLEVKYQAVMDGNSYFVSEQCFTKKIRVCTFDLDRYNFSTRGDLYNRRIPTPAFLFVTTVNFNTRVILKSPTTGTSINIVTAISLTYIQIDHLIVVSSLSWRIKSSSSSKSFDCGSC